VPPVARPATGVEYGMPPDRTLRKCHDPEE